MNSRPPYLSLSTSAGAGERGVVLILAVLAVVLLTTLAVAIAAAVRVELLASRSALERTQALFLAEAGINRARAILLYEDVSVDSLQDPWGPDYEEPLHLPQELGSGSYRVRVIDASGRINVNRANHETLYNLTGDPDIAAAIIDWRDPDDVVRPGGAEWEYYQALPWPYLPRNAPFQSLGELLLVKGMTPQLLFGSPDVPALADLLSVESVSLNVNAFGESRIGLNSFRQWDEEAFRNQIMARLGGALTMYDANEIWAGLVALSNTGQEYTSLAQLYTVAGLSLDKIAAIIDDVAIDARRFARGKVNVNTAPMEVLAALPGSSPELAAAIIDLRWQTPLLSLSEVASLLVDQAQPPEVLVTFIDQVTTKSSSFAVESTGQVREGGVTRNLRAFVRREDDGVPIVHEVEQEWALPPQQIELDIAHLRR